MNQTAHVRMYTTKICPYCFRAKALLAKRGVVFEEIDVSEDPERRMWLVKATGQKTVPQIFIDEKPVGGSDELAALDRTGELVKRVFGPAGAPA